MILSIPRRRRPGVAGFTLIEVLIALAIVALLAAIALPSYRRQVQKSNRVVAKTALLEALSREESRFNDRKSYATALTGLGYTADTVYACNDGQLDCTSSTGIYAITVCTAAGSPSGAQSSSGGTIACADPSGTSVWIKATPINAQNSPVESCGVLLVSTGGVRGQSGTQGTTCWKG